MFFAHAEKTPDRCAIVKDSLRISYGDLAQEVKRTATYFKSKGIEKGDRVLVFVPMSIDLYRTVLALFDIGATVVFLDEWVSRERLNLCCQLAKCKAWIGGWKVHLLSFVSKELRSTPVKLGLGVKTTNTYSKTETSANDVALITFTTGSTGIPKAAIRTHAHLKSQFEALIEEIEPVEGEIDMPVLPIVLLINLGAGCTSVIAPFKAKKAEKMKPEIMVDLMSKEKVSRLVSSPYFAIRVAEYCKENNIKLQDLKKVFTGGAPVFPEEAKQLVEGYSNSLVKIVYGSTEAEPISAVSADELKEENLEIKKGLCVGKLHHATELLILPISEENISVKEENELFAIQLEKEQIGEICVSGNHVLSDYLDNEEAVKRNKIKVGEKCWHRTGDSGFVGEDGKLYLTGRATNLFETNGVVYSPFILEKNIKSLDKVRIGTILKINDKIVLFVDLIEQSISNNFLLEKFPFVDEIVVGSLPKDPRHFSKIDYGRLKEHYMTGR